MPGPPSATTTRPCPASRSTVTTTVRRGRRGGRWTAGSRGCGGRGRGRRPHRRRPSAASRPCPRGRPRRRQPGRVRRGRRARRGGAAPPAGRPTAGRSRAARRAGPPPRCGRRPPHGRGRWGRRRVEQQPLGRRDDRGQRRPQVVGDVGQEALQPVPRPAWPAPRPFEGVEHVVEGAAVRPSSVSGRSGPGAGRGRPGRLERAVDVMVSRGARARPSSNHSATTARARPASAPSSIDRRNCASASSTGRRDVVRTRTRSSPRARLVRSSSPSWTTAAFGPAAGPPAGPGAGTVRGTGGADDGPVVVVNRASAPAVASR